MLISHNVVMAAHMSGPMPSLGRIGTSSRTNGEEIHSHDAEAVSDVDDEQLEQLDNGDEFEAENTDDGSLVGISISRAQTRLMSPSTPAAEKAAAFDDVGKNLFFDGHLSRSQSPIQLGVQETAGGPPQVARLTSDLKDVEPSRKVPTAQRESLRQGPALVTADDGVLDGASVNKDQRRPRSTTLGGFPSQTVQPERRRGSRFSISSFSHLPKLSNLPGLNSALSLLSSSNEGELRRSVQAHINKSSTEQRPSSAAGSSPEHGETRSITRNSKQLRPPVSATSPNPGVLLRRATSDQSLQLSILSRTSSLGDDSRWSDVHVQVNSRMKAIRDSLADSSLRLPSMPNLKAPPSWREFTTVGKRASQPELVSLQTQKASDHKELLQSSSDKTKRSETAHNMKRADALAHPQFIKALETLEGDVVIMGGYRGSVLRWTEPPQRQCWVPVKVGLNIRKVNLEVGLEKEDEEKMSRNIFASGMLKNIGPVEISRRLFKRLRKCRNAQTGKLRVWDYGYDWRLSPHILSRQLVEFLKTLPCNSAGSPPRNRGATVIAHSLGGLITRHAVNTEPALFGGVIYAGVPQTCINILGPLRNGDDVLLSSRVLTAQVNFTIRTSFALLPLDGKCFFNRETKEHFDVDFFDPATWKEYCLSPCINRPLPPLEVQLGMINSLKGSMASVLDSLSLNSKKESSPTREGANGHGRTRSGSAANTLEGRSSPFGSAVKAAASKNVVDTQMDNLHNPQEFGRSEENTVSTAVTIPFDKAYAYLTRTLAEVKQFKMELAYNPSLKDAYPLTALIYGKSVPTVYGACVTDREAIKHADAYDNLAFASGDGVVLARASQLPDGYEAVKGGTVSSERGHISLLGDLEAVGRCLNALTVERKARKRELSTPDLSQPQID